MAAETGSPGKPLDAARSGERVYPSEVELNLKELMVRNFAFGALKKNTIADVTNYSQALYDKGWVQLVRQAREPTPTDPREFEYVPYDGHNRLARLWFEQQRNPAFAPRGHDVTDDLK